MSDDARGDVRFPPVARARRWRRDRSHAASIMPPGSSSDITPHAMAILAHQQQPVLLVQRDDMDPVAIFQHIIGIERDAALRHAMIGAQVDPACRGRAAARSAPPRAARCRRSRRQPRRSGVGRRGELGGARHQRAALFRIPIGRTLHQADLTALAVDEEGRRQAERLSASASAGRRSPPWDRRRRRGSSRRSRRGRPWAARAARCRY